jgi:hypothetical protein
LNNHLQHNRKRVPAEARGHLFFRTHRDLILYKREKVERCC